MAGLSIPATQSDINAEWLTAALRSTGSISKASVVAVDQQAVGEGQGFAAQLVRLVVEYDRDERGAPGSLVAKISSDNPKMLAVARARHIYDREVWFYEQLADEVTLPTARRYYSDLDRESGEFVLLLEDMSTARVGDQLAGCNLEDAQTAIRKVAEFHASWWDNPNVANIKWLPPADSHADEIQVLFQLSWKALVGLAGHRLPAFLIDIGDQFGQNVAELRRQAAKPPQTIVHGDYRLDNLFFESDEGGSFATIDWQLIQRNRGTYDLAWFLSGSLTTPDRRHYENELIDLYCSTLKDHGVTGYSLDQCTEDYRASTLSCLLVAVVAAAAADTTNERGASLLEVLLTRLATAMQDLNVGELLPKG